MREIKARFQERIQRTPTVESFRFSLPEKLPFLPGQFLEIIFDKKNRENKELNKYLSFSSSPLKEYIEVTKRLSSSVFSGRLKSLRINDEVLLRAPLGNCVFQDDYQKIGFLIGGIGITPVVSIIEYTIDSKLDVDVCLLYSNRTEEEVAFKLELDHWSSMNKNIKISYLITEYPPKDKGCVFGRIDKDFIQRSMCDLKGRIIFIFGPPKMVEAMKNIVLELGVEKEKVQTEMFVGY